MLRRLLGIALLATDAHAGQGDRIVALAGLLIDEHTSPPRIAVVDWQSVTLGSPLSEVAYFLGAGLLPDARRGTEGEILDLSPEPNPREPLRGVAQFSAGTGAR
jgi:aminoglycoside phosphotransferase (APT) family kinase protein